MRANEFLFEAEVVPYQSIALSEEQVIAMLRTHCSQLVHLINRPPMWRGVDNHDEPFLLIKPSTGVRRSENTMNYYTLLIDSSPDFAQFPKRSKSLICSTNLHRAQDYGMSGVYAIFPVDGSKIGVCPGADMWDTEVDLTKLDPTGNQGMSSIADIADVLVQLNVECNLESMARGPVIQSSIDFMKKRGIQPDQLLSYLYAIIAPAETGFQVTNPAQLARSTNRIGSKEVWTDGDCIAIEIDSLGAIFERMHG